MNLISAILTGIGRFFQAIFKLSSRNHQGSVAIDDDGDRQPGRKSMVIIVSIIVIVGSVISLAMTMLSPSTPSVNHNYYLGLGEALAIETAKAVHDYGRVAVIVTDDYLNRGTPAHEELEAFQKTLKQHHGIEVIMAKPATLQETDPDQSLPRDQFEKLVQLYSGTAAIVSFIGLPAIDPANPFSLPDKLPKIIAIHTMAASPQEYFRNSIASVLITPRSVVAHPQPAPKTPHDLFDQYFQVVTVSNYAAVAP